MILALERSVELEPNVNFKLDIMMIEIQEHEADVENVIMLYIYETVSYRNVLTDVSCDMPRKIWVVVRK